MFWSQDFEDRVERAIEVLLANPERGGVDNKFFEDYGPGNAYDNGRPILPYERFKWYEDLLRRIQCRDKDKYLEVHKGTPFYFMGWLAFDLGNYQKGFFYIDAAVTQDKRDHRSPTPWIELPAARVLRLETAGHAATRVVNELRDRIRRQLSRDTTVLTVDSLAARLTKHLLVKPGAERSILSAFYTFAREYDDREEELEIRGGEVIASHESHMLHLFRGGLIFESFCRQVYPACDSLDKVFSNSTFLSDFELSRGDIKNGDARSLAQIVKAGRSAQVGRKAQIASCFEVVWKLRNCTGHDLVRDALFIPVSDYRFLVEQEFSAIFEFIKRHFTL